MKIFVGADHQGFLLKGKLVAYLEERGCEVADVGAHELDAADDFPEFAVAAVRGVLAEVGDNDASGDEAGGDSRAILLCGGGQGMAMAANRFRGIRASVIWSEEEARLTRQDNNSNVLCLPARLFDDDEQGWRRIVETWLTTPYADLERYNRRNAQLDELAWA